MGIIRTDITLENPQYSHLLPIKKNALADSGSVHLCIPQQIAEQLNLSIFDTRFVTVADGTTHKVNYVGPICVRWQNRMCITGAMVLGDEVLLGAIPMEDMDLVLNMNRQQITVNPQHPNFPVSIAKASNFPFGKNRFCLWVSNFPFGENDLRLGMSDLNSSKNDFSLGLSNLNSSKNDFSLGLSNLNSSKNDFSLGLSNLNSSKNDLNSSKNQGRTFKYVKIPPLKCEAISEAFNEAYRKK